MKKITLIPICVLFLCPACSELLEREGALIQPIPQKIDIPAPEIEVYSDEELMSECQFFTVFPHNKGISRDYFIEKELLEEVKTILVNHDYTYTKSIPSADFIAGIYFSVATSDVYIPPSTTWLPDFTPSKKITIKDEFGWKVGSLNLPSELKLVPVYRPGYYKAYVFPMVTIYFAGRFYLTEEGELLTYKDYTIYLKETNRGKNIKTYDDLRVFIKNYYDSRLVVKPLLVASAVGSFDTGIPFDTILLLKQFINHIDYRLPSCERKK
ncbi:MAG: hypothetical protein AB1410_00125 [Acidobacteriota bacterium]